MVLENGKLFKYGAINHAGALRAVKKSVLQDELERVEKELRRLEKRTRTLSEDLGKRYMLLRTSGSAYSVGGDAIISISRETDACIQQAYHLQRRRRELMNILSCE